MTIRIRILRALRHQVLVAVADPALHNLTVAAFRVLAASVALAQGLGAVALTASLQEDLDVIVREEETSGRFTATSTGMTLPFATFVEVLLEIAAETLNGFPR